MYKAGISLIRGHKTAPKTLKPSPRVVPHSHGLLDSPHLLSLSPPNVDKPLNSFLTSTELSFMTKACERWLKAAQSTYQTSVCPGLDEKWGLQAKISPSRHAAHTDVPPNYPHPLSLSPCNVDKPLNSFLTSNKSPYIASTYDA